MKWLNFFLLALLVKGGMTAWFVSAGWDQFPEKMTAGIVFKEADYGYFLEPVDKYFETGKYSYGDRPYAGRMPGYWIFYFALRFVFSQDTALVVLILLQVILGALAVWALAATAFRITGSKTVFYLSYLLFLVSAHATVFDFRTITESFSVSAIVFSAFFLFKYRESALLRDMFFAGAFMTWAIFLRPFIGPALLLPGLLLLWWWKTGVVKQSLLVAGTVLYSFFVLAEGAWIARNYSAMGKFIPLESPMHEAYGDLYPRSELKFYELCYAWGENGWGWDHDLAAGWFHDYGNPHPEYFQFKDHYFSNITTYNADSLRALRTLFVEFRNDQTPRARKDYLDSLVEAKAAVYLDDYRRNNFVQYYFTSRVAALKRYLLKGSSGYTPFVVPEKMSVFQKLFRYFSSALYFIFLLGGLVGLFLAVLRKSTREGAAFLLAYVCINIFIIVNVTTSQEPRYFLTCIPFLVAGTAMLLAPVAEKLFPQATSLRD